MTRPPTSGPGWSGSPTTRRGPGQRPRGLALGADLYARDVESYRRLAGQIVSDKVGRPQLSDNLAKLNTVYGNMLAAMTISR